MESFLTDGVRQKLDFYKTLEDMVVPTLFQKNISFVMTLSKRLSTMIDGIIQQVENTLKMGQQQMASQSEATAFKGWMTRFIVTNYEIYIDHLKTHAEFTA